MENKIPIKDLIVGRYYKMVHIYYLCKKEEEENNRVVVYWKSMVGNRISICRYDMNQHLYATEVTMSHKEIILIW